MKTLTDTDITQFFGAHALPPDPVEAERLLVRIKVIVDTVLITVWNKS